jgi:hypothetical protein
MRMRSTWPVSALAVGVALLAGCAQGTMAGGTAASMQGATMDRSTMEGAMSDWAPAAREAATFMTNKYGPPAEMTPTMAVWHNTGPWKRTIVYREAVQHNFPMPHPDVLEQFIDYRVPPDRYDELAMYDGSVIAERTKGELSARCDKEGANFLALNLAHEIATGRRTPEDARRMYGEQIKMMKAGQMTPYTSGLMFTPPPSGNDPDRPIM